MSVSVTLMLAVTVFMLLVAEMIPESSDSVPIVGIFFLFCLSIMVLVIISLSIVSRYHHRERGDRPMDKWTRWYILERLSYAVRIRHDNVPENSKAAGKNTDNVHINAAFNASVNCDDGEDLERPEVSPDAIHAGDPKPTVTCDPEEKQPDIIMKETHQAPRAEDDVFQQDQETYTLEEEWKIVAKTLDRCLFVFFITFFVIGCLCCFANTDYVR